MRASLSNARRRGVRHGLLRRRREGVRREGHRQGRGDRARGARGRRPLPLGAVQPRRLPPRRDLQQPAGDCALGLEEAEEIRSQVHIFKSSLYFILHYYVHMQCKAY